MNLQELLTKLETPIVIRPTRRMTQGELETYLDKAADILRGNADHSEFRGYAFALLFDKRNSDCYEEEAFTLVRAQRKQTVLFDARDPQYRDEAGLRSVSDPWLEKVVGPFGPARPMRGRARKS